MSETTARNRVLPLLHAADRPAGQLQAPVHLFGLEAAELQALLASAGEPKFRAAQVLEWLYVRGATSFEEMTNLPNGLRRWLGERAATYRSSVARESTSADGTRKLLLSFPDGAEAETVWIPAEDRNTVCISSQVGCPVGCRFCASGLEGVERNLAAGEIVEQAMRVRQLIEGGGGGAGCDTKHGPEGRATSPEGRAAGSRAGGRRLSNVVMMGMGEPLANYREVLKALRILNAPWGLNIGARKITVSTVGLPKQIRMLADEAFQFNLALSLHAPDDALRAEIIPWAEGIRIRDLVDACRYYFDRTGREITLEYVLLDGVNMGARQAEQLAAIARSLRANVNLLRYNPVAGLPYRRPSAEAAHAFQARLRAAGVNAHVRKSRGKDVDAACGQLRRTGRASAAESPAEARHE